MNMDMREAAAARAAQLTVGDRPARRSSVEGHVDKHVRATTRVELREASESDSSSIEFTGYASMTEQPYEMYDMFGPYNEVVTRGAFGDTLLSEPDVPLVLQHSQMQRIASTSNGTLQLSEDGTGLLVNAQLDPEDRDVQYIVPKLRSGLINEMSFAFTITASQWSPDYTELRINSVDINRGDVSIVGFGANPYTQASLRARSLEEYLREAADDELETAARRIPHLLANRRGAPDGMSAVRIEIAAAAARLRTHN